VARVAAYAENSVVTIINERPPVSNSQGQLVQTEEVGSGVIVDASGLVLTNEHIISDPGKLTVVLNNGEPRAATLVYSDAPFTDLAVLRIPGGGLKALAFGNSDNLALGQTLVAIGAALGDYRNSVSSGVVSGLHRRYLREGVFMEDLVQTDAAINNGNSGGPLLDLRGEIVGLASNVVRNVGPDDNVFGISLAISSKTMRPIVQAVASNGSYPRPDFGIDHFDLDAETIAAAGANIDHGALVQRVSAGGPAEKAGIQRGDVILRLGQTDVDEDMPFVNALARVGVNDRVAVQVWRGGRVFAATVEVRPR
jgi:2-alkenal reductase